MLNRTITLLFHKRHRCVNHNFRFPSIRQTLSNPIRRAAPARRPALWIGEPADCSQPIGQLAGIDGFILARARSTQPYYFFFL